MAMAFTNVLKAQITQSVIKTLFERAGYRVTRLGVEELFIEVTHLDEAKYKALNLPLALRYLPDFLIAESDLSTAFLLEVKYRKIFNESTIQALRYELTQQREFWPDSYAVLLIADYPYPASHFHQHYIRIVPPSRTALLRPLEAEEIARHQRRLASGELRRDCEEIWEGLPMLTTLKRFRAIGDTGINLTNADVITTIIKALQNLP
jgi:hypothetical protein